MAITIHSPHSGRPVKVREQDVGRAIRDEEGRIFYVIPRDDSGYYAALTRKGSDKDLQRYDDLLAKVERGEVAAEAAQRPPVHDATGPGRPGSKRRAIFLVVLLLVIAAITYYVLSVRGYVPPIPGLSAPPAAPTIDPAVPTPDIVPEAPPVKVPDDGPIGAAPDGAAIVQPARLNTVPAPSPPDTVALPSGAAYRVVRPGEGAAASAGSVVELAVFREGEAEAMPLQFVLWAGQVDRALDEAVAGMRVGERRLVRGPAPAFADVFDSPTGPVAFTLELLAVRPGVTTAVVKPGDGPVAGPGDQVELDYLARVAGRQRPFATSGHAPPLEFTLGEGQVIPGLELGVLGMAVGETRRLTIPPTLAYGKTGFGEIIPAGSTLIYEVTLRGIGVQGTGSRDQAEQHDLIPAP